MNRLPLLSTNTGISKILQSQLLNSSNGVLSYLFGGAILGGALTVASNRASANEALAPPKHPWDHESIFNTFDYASIRRGFLVYRQVCASCHSLNLIAWRHLVDVVGTEDEIKEMALEETYEDGPDEQGENFDRPGKLTDSLPKPYPNDNAARAANAGALPPDLSLMKKARVGGEDYIFSLLTGYHVPPKGINLREGLYYNPYFPGSAIGMQQALHDGMVDYEDGTDASISQMAKDVSVFLSWTAEPEHDERKKLGFKSIFLLTLMTIPTLYFKRLKFAPIKTRQIRFTPIKSKNSF